MSPKAEPKPIGLTELTQLLARHVDASPATVAA